MNTMIKSIILVISINVLVGCSSVVGNVVPQQGKTMEQVYDGMSSETLAKPNVFNKQKIKRVSFNTGLKNHTVTAENEFDHEFKKAINPDLKVYIYPHFAGNDNVPVPGYYTVLSAYEHDHYDLSRV